MVCANKFGAECSEARFCGMSLIVEAGGQVLAKAAPDEAALLTGKVTVAPEPMGLSDEISNRLLETSPVLPPTDAKAMRVALLPGRLLHGPDEPAGALRTFHSLANHDVKVAMLCCEPNERTIVAQHAAAAAGVRLITNLEAGRLIRANDVAVGCVASHDAECFASPRLMALGGGQVLAVFGQINDLATLRVRAVENRIFVVAVSRDGLVAIGPDGKVLSDPDTSQTEPAVVVLDLPQAANKLVARQTDVWVERRPAAYRLG